MRCSHPSRDSSRGALRCILLLIAMDVHTRPRIVNIIFVWRLDSTRRDTTTIRSLILLHDIRECLLIKVAAWFVLRTFVDWNRATPTTRCVRYHEIFLVSWACNLRLGSYITRYLILTLLRKTIYDLVDNFVCWVAGISGAIRMRNQILSFLDIFIWIEICHCCELLAIRGNWTMAVLTGLRV